MKHSNDPAFLTLYDMIDDNLKAQDVCGTCLGILLLRAASETVRCLDVEQLEQVRPEIDRLLAASASMSHGS